MATSVGRGVFAGVAATVAVVEASVRPANGVGAGVAVTGTRVRAGVVRTTSAGSSDGTAVGNECIGGVEVAASFAGPSA